jgi:hypothetical protein
MVDFLVVVNLSVGCHDDITITGNERLLSRLGIHDGKTFMCDTMVEWSAAFLLDNHVAGPIGTSVAEFGRTFDEFLSKIGGIE